MKPVTQLDIAKALGISQTTVGLVVGSSSTKGISKLSPETIERIRAKALEMGYRPHRHAQVMRTGTSMQVGIIYGDSLMQVAKERLAYVVQALRQHRYEVIFHDSVWHKGDIRRAIEQVMDSKVAGILMTANYTKPTDDDYLQTVPLPIVGLSSAHMSSRPQIRCDMRDGILQVFRHLAGQGYRRIVLLSFSPYSDVGPDDWRWQAGKQALGFCDGVRESGGTHDIISINDYKEWARRRGKSKGLVSAAIICSTREINLSYDAMDPYQLAARFARIMITSGGKMPDAVICPNDDWAYGFACEAMRHGIRIPHDMALTGFNDASLGRAFVVPLTTIRQATEQMSTKAVDLLIQEIQGNTPERTSSGTTILEIPGELIVRDSSCRV